MLFATVALLPTVNLYPDGSRMYALNGTAHVGPEGRELPATFWITCYDTASINVGLDVSARDPEFDLKDFRGGVDTSQGIRLSRLTWIAAERNVSISVPASMWVNPTSVQFNSDELKAQPGPLSELLLAIEAAGRSNGRTLHTIVPTTCSAPRFR
jgi:hypothetical protein